MPELLVSESARPLPSAVVTRLGGSVPIRSDGAGVGEGVGEGVGLGPELSLSMFLTVTVDVSVPV